MKDQRVVEAVEKLFSAIGPKDLKAEIQCLTIGYVAKENEHLTGSECASTVFASMALLEFFNDIEKIRTLENELVRVG